MAEPGVPIRHAASQHRVSNSNSSKNDRPAVICVASECDLQRIGDAYHGLRRVDRVLSDSIMLRLSGPTLLTLSLAFPGVSLALGLGDIHVESTLHQTLVAQIDLVGATNEDLARLKAGIANEEIFSRYNLQRPAFLAGTTVVVGQDGQGHPVLVLRSSETFTEPLVTFIVDLHSPAGEMIREYTVLLDPPSLAPKPSSVESTPAPPVAQTEAPAAVITVSEPAVGSPDVKPP